ncbi:MAG TPA: YdeI/OmpD-associated family protein [Saprospiraceae bacterium]|nr:YdeI/OmpD-associated family protein [Saprospiraceae bacterium]
MHRFKATIEKFKKQGEKTGWTYIRIPHAIAEKINPGVRKSFRIKGKLDQVAFEGLNLLPMGEGDFILALNTNIRKAINKKQGDLLNLAIELDPTEYSLNAEFQECLETEPKALTFFKTLTRSHQNYFSKWIESAKTINTRHQRIAEAINALHQKQGYPEMIRARKKEL